VPGYGPSHKVPVKPVSARAWFGVLWSFHERLAARPGAGDDFLPGIVFTSCWVAAQPARSDLIRRAEDARSTVQGSAALRDAGDR
jgi:hypothetical protein